MKTDKSCKFAVTSEAEYIAMGQEHTKNDRKLNRQEIIEMAETVNGHTRAWYQIWNSGQAHVHTSRIMESKTAHSENIADLYLMFKDHKPGKKTRPTATGHSSNSLGLSNAIAEVLEAVANFQTRRYNTISSEDMLARIREYNKSIITARQEWYKKAVTKLTCKTCKIMEYTDCPETESHGWDKIYQQESEIQKTPITSTNGEMGSYNIQSKACQGVPEPWQEIIEEQAIQEAQKLLDTQCCGKIAALVEKA